jgi:hypothetical protein
MEEDTDREGRDELPQVAFDYIKGHLFRVVHADGVIGGPSPNGGLHLAFFSERAPIPQREVRSINSDGSLGGLIVDKSIVRPAIVREIDFDVVMSIPVAEVLISWLQERVEEIKSRTTSPEQPSGDGEPK